MKKFIFVSTAVIVEGFLKDCILDFNNYTFYQIPKSLTQFIRKYEKGYSIDEIYKIHKHNNIVNEYIEFLTEKELILFTNDIKGFNNLETKWDSPSEILNSIIELDKLSIFYKAFDQLNNLNCKSYEIRIDKDVPLSTINKALNYINYSRCQEINLVFYSNKISIKAIKQLIFKFPHILRISIYEAERNKETIFNNQIFKIPITYFSKSLKYIEKNHFYSVGIVNILYYSESLVYNTYLNRKIFIDKIGDIYNAPNLMKRHCNISDCNIVNVIHKTDFQELFKVNKNEIDICQNCEFRHTCYNTSDLFFTKKRWEYIKKCDYNPFISKWNGEEGWISVEEWRKKLKLEIRKDYL